MIKLIHRSSHRLRLLWYRATRPEVVMKGSPFRQIWVDPKVITKQLPERSLKQSDHLALLRAGKFCRFRAIGLVEDGDWHKQATDYTPEIRLLFKAMSDRYYGKRAWQDTEFITMVLDRIEQGMQSWNGCRNHEDVLNRCERADRLIESVKQYGFQVNADPVAVCIGPDGSVIKSGNGQHRIILGKITGSKIPVLPIVRHKVWEEIRTGRSERSLEFSDHPDMAV